jgi:hypothetical protein
MMIKKTKTNILVLLAWMDLTRLFDSPTKRTSFNIRNTLNSLKILNAVRYWEPTKNRERYFGIVDKKSTIPKKLNIYFLGRLMEIILKMYSIENKMVTTHSE